MTRLIIIAAGLLSVVLIAAQDWPYDGSTRVQVDHYMTRTCLDRFGVTMEVRTLSVLVNRQWLFDVVTDTVSWPCETEETAE